MGSVNIDVENKWQKVQLQVSWNKYSLFHSCKVTWYSPLWYYCFWCGPIVHFNVASLLVQHVHDVYIWFPMPTCNMLCKKSVFDIKQFNLFISVSIQYVTFFMQYHSGLQFKLEFIDSTILKQFLNRNVYLFIDKGSMGSRCWTRSISLWSALVSNAVLGSGPAFSK